MSKCDDAEIRRAERGGRPEAERGARRGSGLTDRRLLITAQWEGRQRVGRGRPSEVYVNNGSGGEVSERSGGVGRVFRRGRGGERREAPGWERASRLREWGKSRLRAKSGL